MKTLLLSIVTTLGFIACGAAFAQAPATAPAGTTGLCKDGSWSSAASKKGACHGHKGVKEWYAAADTSSTATKSTAAKSTSPAPASKPAKAKHETPAASPSSTASASSPPASAPAGTTGMCNDGTYYSGESKRGACRGHKGVKTWYGASTKTSMPATPAAAPTPAPMSTPPTAATPPTATTPAKSAAPAAMPASPAPTASTSPAPGGGSGKVWVNTSSKVYHCSGDRYYGTTKQGEYMSEADAVAKGNRPSHGKACSP